MLSIAETLMWSVVLGLLIGIVWSLKYLVILDKRIERIEYKIERTLRKIEDAEEKILKKTPARTSSIKRKTAKKRK